MQFTDKHKENIKKSKLEYYKSKYKWDLVEPYLDIEVKNGARNRKHKFITLRDFKKLKVDQNKSIKEMEEEGYSRYILGFCSRFCRGMINLSKDDLKKDYKEIDLDEISKKYKIDRGDISLLRQLYGIKSTSGMYFRRIREEKPLTNRQIEILYGTMLGDACGDSGRRISFKQGDCQREYIFWKFDEFKEHCNPSALKAYRNVNEKYGLDNVSWQFRTKFNSEFEKCIKQFYKEGKKEAFEDISNYLTSLSIAVWFMDDGVTSWNHKRRVETGYNISPHIYFCTDSFSVDSCNILMRCLENKFNINTHLVKAKALKDGSVPYNIAINKESKDDFFDLISEHIISSFKYKICYDAYKEKLQNKEF